MNKERKVALILSVGGTVWLVTALWRLFALHLDRPEAGLFFVAGASPALAVYAGWILCAVGKLRGGRLIPLWIASIAVTIDYGIVLRPAGNFALAQPFETFSTAWLILAACVSIRGLVIARQTAAAQNSLPPEF